MVMSKLLVFPLIFQLLACGASSTESKGPDRITAGAEELSGPYPDLDEKLSSLKLPKGEATKIAICVNSLAEKSATEDLATKHVEATASLFTCTKKLASFGKLNTSDQALVLQQLNEVAVAFTISNLTSSEETKANLADNVKTTINSALIILNEFDFKKPEILDGALESLTIGLKESLLLEGLSSEDRKAILVGASSAIGDTALLVDPTVLSSLVDGFLSKIEDVAAESTEYSDHIILEVLGPILLAKKDDSELADTLKTITISYFPTEEEFVTDMLSGKPLLPELALKDKAIAVSTEKVVLIANAYNSTHVYISEKSDCTVEGVKQDIASDVNYTLILPIKDQNYTLYGKFINSETELLSEECAAITFQYTGETIVGSGLDFDEERCEKSEKIHIDSDSDGYTVEVDNTTCIDGVTASEFVDPDDSTPAVDSDGDSYKDPEDTCDGWDDANLVANGGAGYTVYFDADGDGLTTVGNTLLTSEGEEPCPSKSPHNIADSSSALAVSDPTDPDDSAVNWTGEAYLRGKDEYFARYDASTKNVVELSVTTGTSPMTPTTSADVGIAYDPFYNRIFYSFWGSGLVFDLDAGKTTATQDESSAGYASWGTMARIGNFAFSYSDSNMRIYFIQPTIIMDNALISFGSSMTASSRVYYGGAREDAMVFLVGPTDRAAESYKAVKEMHVLNFYEFEVTHSGDEVTITGDTLSDYGLVGGEGIIAAGEDGSDNIGMYTISSISDNTITLSGTPGFTATHILTGFPDTSNFLSANKIDLAANDVNVEQDKWLPSYLTKTHLYFAEQVWNSSPHDVRIFKIDMLGNITDVAAIPGDTNYHMSYSIGGFISGTKVSLIMQSYWGNQEVADVPSPVVIDNAEGDSATVAAPTSGYYKNMATQELRGIGYHPLAPK